MLTRSKQFYRREKTADDPVRENEKYSLRVLEECKRKIASDAEIPKNDRLELRKHIRNGCSLILELFRKHKANPSKPLLNVRPQFSAGWTAEVRREMQTHSAKRTHRIVQELGAELTKDAQCRHQDHRK